MLRRCIHAPPMPMHTCTTRLCACSRVRAQPAPQAGLHSRPAHQATTGVLRGCCPCAVGTLVLFVGPPFPALATPFPAVGHPLFSAMADCRRGWARTGRMSSIALSKPTSRCGCWSRWYWVGADTLFRRIGVRLVFKKQRYRLLGGPRVMPCQCPATVQDVEGAQAPAARHALAAH
jgi:hypothetical protein